MPLRVLEHVIDCGGDRSPALALDLELSPSGGRDLVRTSTAIVLRGDRSRLDPARLLHAMQGRIQRAFLDAKDIRQLMDSRRNGVAVQRSSSRQHIQDEQWQGTLKRIGACCHTLLSELSMIPSELSMRDYTDTEKRCQSAAAL